MKRLAVLALLALALCGQTDEDQPFFSLTSSRTFAPGEKATIQITAADIDSLDFRVYKVRDPLKFFSRLEDLHQFGGRAERPQREPTLIERFHRVKARWHAQMFGLVREQFTGESWESVRSVGRGKQDVREHNVTNFASAPVLNQQQLVATWRQHVESKGRWRSQTIDAEVRDNGVYLVEAARGDLRAYTIVQISDIALISKSSMGRIVAFVANRKTGEPVAQSAVTFQPKNKPAVTAKTDANGLASIDAVSTGEGDTLLCAKAGASFAAATVWTNSVEGEPSDQYTGYTYTDRPVYRPGHQVFFKSILRAHTGNVYSLPDIQTADVEVQGPENKTVFHKTLPVSAMGAAAGDFTLPKDAGLGYYSIQIKASETTVEAGFQVEEYKKPEYDVRVTPVKNRVLQGDSISATIEARYFFGEPVANAKVHYVVHRSRYWFPIFQQDDDAEPADGDGDSDLRGGEDEQLSDEQGTLDGEGKLTVTIPTAVDEHAWDARYRIEARVTDAGNREISGASSVIATYGPYWVDVEPASYVLAPGAADEFHVQTRDYDNNPVSAKVQLDAYASGSRKNPLSVAHAEVQTDTQGEAKATLTLPKGGSYRVHAHSATSANREVGNDAYVWVSSRDSSLFGRSTGSIQIVPDKKTYKPGDTAKVLIVTGAPKAKLLFTIEGRTLGDARVIEAVGPTATVEVPIGADSVPDFWVGATFIQDNEIRQGTKAIKVPATDRKLALTVATSKPQYQPGETAQFTLEARDAAGKPVMGDFSVGVVDEAIYGIRPDATPDIMRVFYGPGYNRVMESNSLSYYFTGEGGKRRMELARLHRAHALAQIKPERLVQPKVRKAFPDTAVWLASVKTDAQGKATAAVPFPDSVTTWRATVRGATADTKVASIVQKTLVRKNVILRLVVPRFFTSGDEVTVSAVVHNYLASEKQARVSIEARGLEIVDGAPRDLTIPSKGEVKVDYRVRASKIGDATITGKALTDEESDAMELTLPVEPQGVKMAQSHSGSVSQAKPQAEARIEFPAQSIAPTRNIEISVSPSLAGALFGAIDYLTAFPYGCTEQTLSSFVPNIVVSKALGDLGIQSNVNHDLLAEKIRVGLDRLYDFQHEDGGWGWWKTDESSLFMTANALAGLAQAKNAGRELKEGVLDNGAKWLRSAYDREPRMIPDLKAFSAYALALAGANDPKVVEEVWSRKNDLSPYGRALLGLTLEAANDKRAAEIAGLLESAAKSNDAEAWWPADRDTLMDFYFDDTPEVTAYALKLLVHEKPQSPLLEKAAVWLLNHRGEGYFWFSTKQTAMVVYGLTDYLKATGELKPQIQATVTVNGRQVLTKQFQPKDALSTDTNKIVIPAVDLAAATNTIQVAASGTGRVYWSVRGNYFSTEQKLVKTGSASLNLLRDYFKLTPTKDNDKIVYSLDPLQGPLAVGDILAVRITVTGSAWKYLLMEDPIPAGAEFIERDDLYQLKSPPNWWSTFFSRREFHDDRAAIFDTWFPAGQKQYFYLLKIVNPGQFHVSPARAEPMYQPGNLSTSENKLVEVR